ncbi:MAG TPA: haloalkane dehalogenase [Candidatus Sulfotelmatobacter sp.]|nr:haloalkane dehalogenase [Candidatus Sulfotelmatobacter sp.]
MARIDSLRTPEPAFAAVPDFAYAPLAVDDLPGYEGLRLTYVDAGPPGAAHVFLCLHGNPTWSFLYRRMFAVFLAEGARVIAPDLYGFGRSDKPTDERVYTFDFHRDALLRFVERLDLRGVTLVCQDWGGLLGLTLPPAQPDRFARVIAMNTLLATGDVPIREGFFAWKDYSNSHPDMDVAALLRRSTPILRDAEAAAYGAPFPDARYKAGVRAFPDLVPVTPEMDGTAIAREARDWWRTQWRGATFLAAGGKDPVLGEPAMLSLQSVIRDAPPPVVFPDAGHFIQEWGEPVARAALAAFRTSGA